MRGHTTVAPAGSDSTRARYDRLIRRYAEQGRELERLTTELREYKSKIGALSQELAASKTDQTTLREENTRKIGYYYLENVTLRSENDKLRSELSSLRVAAHRPASSTPAERTSVAARLAILAASTGQYSPRQLAMLTRGAESAVEHGRRLQYSAHPEIVLGALIGNFWGATGLDVTRRYALIAEAYDFEWALACGDISPDCDGCPEDLPFDVAAAQAHYAAYVARTRS